MKKNYLNQLKQQNLNILKKKEEDTGFDESIKINDIKKSFFFLGPENKWQKKLPKEILSKAEKEFKDDLKYFNY